MRAVERATRAELRALGVKLVSSALGRAAVDLARRLDADPGDRAAAMLVRELRLVVGELVRQHKGDLVTETERFLASIANPTFQGSGD